MKSNLNVDDFLNITKPSVAYLLGLLWSDGHISKNTNYFNISIVTEDMADIENIFDQIGGWLKYDIIREGRKPQKQIGASHEEIHSFLLEHDYAAKSSLSAEKILSKIPIHLKHYWFRGLVDGDGCYYLNTKKRNKSIFVASSYEQEWSFLEQLCKELGIDYKIKRRCQKSGKNSIFTITKSYAIKRFGEYIYKSYDTDKIGITRKRNKFLEQLKYIDSEIRQSKNYIGVRQVKDKYKVIIKIKNRLFSFSYFKNAKDAALFYDNIAKKYITNAKLNSQVFVEDFINYAPAESKPSLLNPKYLQDFSFSI